jgi:hypothetical protein
MAVSAEALVAIDLDPVLALDPTLRDAIPARVEAEMALQGWGVIDLTDKRSAYIAILVTKSFVSRLLLKFAQEIKKTAGGTASVEFQDAIKYLEALRDELEARKIAAASAASPSSLVTADRWPGVGVAGL